MGTPYSSSYGDRRVVTEKKTSDRAVAIGASGAAMAAPLFTENNNKKSKNTKIRTASASERILLASHEGVPILPGEWGPGFPVLGGPHSTMTPVHYIHRHWTRLDCTFSCSLVYELAEFI